ncbi:MAG: tetratricopeptide repeat protein [Candidatus Zixiibacteriota bacterium]
MFRQKISILFQVLLGTILLVNFCLQKSASAVCPFEIKIHSDKTEYLTREPISVRYEVKNISDSTICFAFDNVKEFFNIKDQQERGYANIEHGDYFICPDTIHPNEVFKGSEGIDSRYRIFQPGEYTCFLDFFVCKSNILKIKVKNPTGDERKALDLYLEAQKLHWCKDKNPKKWEQAFYKYLELADKYPKSVYAPMSLYTALFKAHVIKDKNKVISVCKKLIENYPDFYYIDDTFYNLVGNYKVLEDKAGAIEYMKELIKKYPNTKISERAEYWLERIKDGKFE